MTIALFWSLLGALIGIAAANRRGFSVAGGILGGLLLGPLAVLMFAVSGVSRSEGKRQRCPHCREWMRADASVCPHCQRDVGAAPMEPPMKPASSPPRVASRPSPDAQEQARRR